MSARYMEDLKIAVHSKCEPDIELSALLALYDVVVHVFIISLILYSHSDCHRVCMQSEWHATVSCMMLVLPYAVQCVKSILHSLSMDFIRHATSGSGICTQPQRRCDNQQRSNKIKQLCIRRTQTHRSAAGT